MCIRVHFVQCVHAVHCYSGPEPWLLQTLFRQLTASVLTKGGVFVSVVVLYTLNFLSSWNNRLNPD